MRILLVDDSRAMLAIVKRIILAAGLDEVEIQTAQNGEEGIEIFQRFFPDLVLSDWHMPGISGLEMLHTLRQLAGRPVRFGFITTESQANAIEEAKRAGATFVLHKPFRDDQLKENLLAIAKNLKIEGDQNSLIHVEKLDAIFHAHLNRIPFRLVERPLQVSDLSQDNLLALYGVGSGQQISLVGLMDTMAMLMLGGAAKRLSPQVAKQAMLMSKAGPADVEAAVLFLKSAVSSFNPRAVEKAVLLRHSLVSRELPKLKDLLTRHQRHSPFRLDIPGYGAGRISFVQL